MTTRQRDQEAERRAAVDAAAADAVRLVAATYAQELAGHPLNRRQQQMADRAARLARVLVRIDQQKRGRP